MSRILVADDEPQMCMILEYVLSNRGWSVDTATNGVQALEKYQGGHYDLVVLDVTMPRLGGLEVCRRIRALAETPVIMLTARAQTEHVLNGFEAGADDYVTKPFEPDILIARIEAFLRRSRTEPSRPLSTAGIVFDDRSRSVVVRGRSTTLSDVEWRLLRALADRPGDVVSWRRLLAATWDVEDRAGGRELVKASIYRLRQRLGPDGAAIETVRGGGYRLCPDPE